jgi:hypothetical protein
MIIALPSENPDANQDLQTRGGQNPAYRLTRQISIYLSPFCV